MKRLFFPPIYRQFSKRFFFNMSLHAHHHPNPVNMHSSSSRLPLRSSPCHPHPHLLNPLFPATRRRNAPKKIHASSSPPPNSSSSSSAGGLRLLEWAGRTGILPGQGTIVKTAKFGWNQLWLTFMRELAPQSNDGGYKRPSYTFQHRIGQHPDFPAVTDGRYVLYLGNACPWCHRVAMTVALRGLSNSITVVQAVDDPEKASRGGWIFPTPEPVFKATDLRQVYDACTPGGSYTGRCTAPVLIDAKTKRIVCNESAVLVRNLNEANFPGASWIDLCPADLQQEIDDLNDRIYESVNNGVYKSGFATTQSAHDAAQATLWSTLHQLDTTLEHRRFLCGDRFTEADLRLFPTAVRFDAVYVTLFKCAARRWQDFPHLQRWLLDCCALPLPVGASGGKAGGGGVLLDTVDVDGCRESYFTQLFPLNPGGIVPFGPSSKQLFGGTALLSSKEEYSPPRVYYRKIGQ